MDDAVLSNLRKTIKLAKESPFYKTHLREIGYDINDILEIPFSCSKDLIRDPLSFVPIKNRNKIQVILTSSGYTQKPKTIFFTKSDIAIFRKAVKELLAPLIGPADRVLSMATFGPHVSGFCIYSAMLELKTTFMPISVDMSQYALQALMKNKFTVMITFYPLLLKIIEESKKTSINPKSFRLKKIILGGTPLSQEERELIEETFDAEVYNTYGMAEAFGFIGIEQECKKGFHILPSEYFIPEIVDESGKETKKGEFVLTCLKRGGTQLIRYKTGDVVEVVEDGCSCDINTPKLNVIGRYDDMLIVGSMNLFWDKILENSILEIADVKDYLVEIVKRGGYDTIKLILESNRNVRKEEVLQAIKKGNYELYDQISSEIIKLEVLTRNKIPKEHSLKLKKVVDKRGEK